MTVAEFILKRKKTDLKERSAAQEHSIDLCRLVGHPTPAEADPAGVTFCLEKAGQARRRRWLRRRVEEGLLRVRA